MAEPTTRFRKIPLNTAVAALDTASERLGAITGEAVVSTGAGNEADFGTVDISAGAADSILQTLLWDVTDDGGNTLVETFKLWMSSNGFDIAGSVCKVRPLSGADNAAPSNTANYVADATVASYTWADMAETEPAGINVWPTDEGTSMDCPGTNGAADDVVFWAMYLAIAAGETTGTYKGLDAGYQLQYSFKYSYS